MGTSPEKLFSRTRPGNPKIKTLAKKIFLFCKLIKEKSPAYLFQLIPENNTLHTTRSVQKSQIPFFKTKTNYFKNVFLPAVIMEWNEIDFNIRNSLSCYVFKKVILKFIRPEPNQVFC